jgi:hypothetical protein
MPQLATLAALAIIAPLWTVGTMLGLLGIPVGYRIGVLLGVPALCSGGSVLGVALERHVRSGAARALVLPGLVALIEGLLRVALPGIPVPSLAWSQRPDSLLIHSGLALGTPLPVTFLIVLTNVGIADAMCWLQEWHSGRPSRLPMAATLAVLAFVSNLAFGFARSTTTEVPIPAMSLAKGNRP